MKRLSIIIVLLLLAAPVMAQSMALVVDGSSYAPIQFLPGDLRQSITVDTPGHAILQGIECVKLSSYASHIRASATHNADEKLVELKWWDGDRILNLYLLPEQHGLDMAWGVRDMRRRDDQPQPGGQSMQATCARVIDGDTIVLTNGERLRYIGVDTPEMNASDATQRQFAESAKRINRGLVEGRPLTVQPGVGQRDRYGRLLGYVWAGDIFVNGALMAGGFAQVMTIPPNVRHVEYFQALGAQAREANRGLWRAEAQKTTARPTPAQSTGGVTVYVTPTGAKYHRAGCRHLRQSKSAISLQAAKAAGYTPCKVCKPPQ